MPKSDRQAQRPATSPTTRQQAVNTKSRRAAEKVLVVVEGQYQVRSRLPQPLPPPPPLPRPKPHQTENDAALQAHYGPRPT
ncbi:hypothetical protein RSOLAG1IB_10587 [Rhizoctonia solani AG-1 IB]|uniref:Uncharacterized protein n=1 Tax=Thanatephorus cucumeris (strain AG1-IB / isolate 7/3/14) TaxID=1108050 RepID=A0A0B7FYZ5_THACB|nr:hypothetical protein RSOLAG1IB_10587 [Rhizoctonia solani AG-1 IB]